MKTLILILSITMAGNLLVAQEPFPNLEKIRPVDIVDRVIDDMAEHEARGEVRSILEKPANTPTLAKPKIAKPVDVIAEDEIAILKAEIRSLERRLSELENLVGPKPVEAPIITVRNPVVYIPAQQVYPSILFRNPEPEKRGSSSHLFRRYVR